MTWPSEEEGLRRLKVPDGRSVRYMPNSTPECFNSIERGVVFVVAWWSIYSLQAWVRMKDLLEAIDDTRILEVVVLDIDGMTGFESTAIGATIAGVGEMVCVKSGFLMADKWEAEPEAVRASAMRLLAQFRELPGSDQWT